MASIGRATHDGLPLLCIWENALESNEFDLWTPGCAPGSMFGVVVPELTLLFVLLGSDSAMAQSYSSSSSESSSSSKTDSGRGRRRSPSINSRLGIDCLMMMGSGMIARLSSQGRLGQDGKAQEYPSVLDLGEEMPKAVLFRSGMIGDMICGIVIVCIVVVLWASFTEKYIDFFLFFH